MDAVSYSLASKQAQRIEKFIENPDSNSGVLTQPKVIEAGETVTIKSGRQAILADTIVDGDLVIEAGGDVFVPAGAGFGDLESQIALKADTSYVNGKYSGFKNYIINGGMKIAQRKGTAQNTYTDEFVADRFKCTTVKDGIAHRPFLGSVNVGNKATMPCTYMAIVTQSTDINRLHIEQRFEQNMFSNFNVGDAVTFSFILGHNGTVNPLAIVEAEVHSYNVVDSPSSGTTVVHTSPILTNMGIAPQFGNKYTWTFNLNSAMIANGFTIILYIHTDVSTSLGAINSTFRIGEVQLERGSVATPFEHRPIGLELSLCQRYYESVMAYVSGIVHANGDYRGPNIAFKVQKRVTPTASPSSIALSGFVLGVNGTGVNLSGSIEGITCDVNMFTINNIGNYANLSASVGGGDILYCCKSAGYINFNAEL